MERSAFVARIAGLALSVALTSAGAGAAEPWLALPPTPVLPKPAVSGYAPVNGARLWYATFGTGKPVILVHGGMANANYWGLQVRALAPYYRVIVVDSRCHGRSTCPDAPLGYDLMASDILGLMDYLHVDKAALVGWSDGAIIGLDIAIHHPERLDRLFAFAANSNPSGTKDVSRSRVFTEYESRAQREYATLSPAPGGYAAFARAINAMWASQPSFTRAQLRAIAVPAWIVDADHDEAIKRSDTDYLAATIPGASELILPGVSHFAFLQDPSMFDEALLHFLNQP